MRALSRLQKLFKNLELIYYFYTIPRHHRAMSTKLSPAEWTPVYELPREGVQSPQSISSHPLCPLQMSLGFKSSWQLLPFEDQPEFDRTQMLTNY